MRLYTVEYENKETVAVSQDGKKLYSTSSLGVTVSDMNDLILRWESLFRIITERLAANTAPVLRDYRILAPIPTPLQDIVCLGVNYREHIEETADITDFTDKKDAVYFSKRTNRCTGPDGLIPNYDFVKCLDYEVELGVILGKDAFRVSKEAAADYILGYTIINDVSARDIQLKHQQWYLGKSLDGYTVMGPSIVTADEIETPHDLNIRCYVNDELRQDSNTSYMITTAEEAIAELSQGMTLKAGTVIATGTPGGVGMGMKPPVFLSSDDIIRCELEGIGTLTNGVKS